VERAAHGVVVRLEIVERLREIAEIGCPLLMTLTALRSFGRIVIQSAEQAIRRGCDSWIWSPLFRHTLRRFRLHTGIIDLRSQLFG
jgi:hypothetical protein